MILFDFWNRTNGSGEEAGIGPLLIVTTGAMQVDNPIMKYLDASTRGGANKIFKRSWNLKTEFRVDDSEDTYLLQLSKGLTEKYEGRQIVLLVDEILDRKMSSKLGEQNFPESVRMILIRNPAESYEKNTLSLPPSFLHVTLTTPYRSTIAITRLARFMARREGLLIPEGDFGSDVEGTKPIFFDVGVDEKKMKEALEHCRKHMGDNVTILYCDGNPDPIDKMVKDQGKDDGGPWACYYGYNFFGWEAERVVAVTYGGNLMEMITRARTHLAVILVDCDAETREHFLQAEDKGLVDVVHLSAN